METIDSDFESGSIGFEEWFKKKNIENGYIFCQECTDKTDGKWEVWVNPNKLCEHLKESEE